MGARSEYAARFRMGGGGAAFVVTAVASAIWMGTLFREWAGSWIALDSVLESQVAIVGSAALSVACWLGCRQTATGYVDLWGTAPRSESRRRLDSLVVISLATGAGVLTIGVGAVVVNSFLASRGFLTWPLVLLLCAGVIMLAAVGFVIGVLLGRRGPSLALIAPVLLAIAWFLWSGFAGVIWNQNWKRWLGLLYASPLPPWREYLPGVPLLQVTICLGVLIVCVAVITASERPRAGVVAGIAGVGLSLVAVQALSGLTREDFTAQVPSTPHTVECGQTVPRVCLWRSEPPRLRSQFRSMVVSMYGGLEGSGVPGLIRQQGVESHSSDGSGVVAALPADEGSMGRYAAEQFLVASGCEGQDFRSPQLRQASGKAFDALISRARGVRVDDQKLETALGQVAMLCR